MATVEAEIQECMPCLTCRDDRGFESVGLDRDRFPESG